MPTLNALLFKRVGDNDLHRELAIAKDCCATACPITMSK